MNGLGGGPTCPTVGSICPGTGANDLGAGANGLGGDLVHGLAGNLAGNLANGLAHVARTAAGDAVTSLFTWWTGARPASVQSAVVIGAQRYATVWVAMPIAVLAVLVAVAWGVSSPDAPWPRDLLRGAVVFGVTAGGSVPVVAALQRWSESLSTGLLGAIPREEVGRRVIAALSLPGIDPAQITFWSVLVFLVSTVQYLAMILRDGAIVIITVLLPVAAAGQFHRGSALWLPRLVGWLVAFLAFKPAAALVYEVGFGLIGNAPSITGIGEGLGVMVTAVLALPALLRLMSFAVTPPAVVGEVGRRAVAVPAALVAGRGRGR